ncbi:MAG: pyruvate:ferredoxin (flavodoxin) oxidoreductase [Bacteroidales bacterium]|nr:pyruvate:ferredoxin (flavodoxin) oxidoreductase [Bacteroidales bacterium]
MATKKNFITCEGNYAAAYIAYMFSEVAAIYPITPSSDMAEYVDQWAAHGKKNIFGKTVMVSEMQSEGGASGAVHGSLQAGALTSTFTASQGLLLMIPNMYKISGELLPGVFHVSARSLAAQALSIFGDHSDVMSTRQAGFAMLATGSAQEIMDIAGIAHLAAIKTRIPFLHFFDGFRTSHEIMKVEAMDQNEMAKLLDWEALKRFKQNALNPENPVTRGTAQNPDIYFQAREASNPFYEVIPDVVEDYMLEIQKITGREYHPFTYYGAPDAENIIIAMGSITHTIQEVVDYELAQGKKVGVITVHLYRPFSEKYFMKVFPKTVKRIAVLDRTKEIGANGEPLYLDVRDLFYEKENKPMIIGGRYGLSSKDTTPAMILSVFQNLESDNPKNRFTVGIVDDVTNHSLPLIPEISVSKPGTFEAKFYGLGADGTVGANKNSIKIIGNNTDKYAQAYFAYDSKKSGGFTTSHLRFGDSPINSHYLVNQPDFVACHVPAYLTKYDMLKGLKKGGSFLLNSIWDEDETKERLPNNIKRYLAENDINLYIINATKIAMEIGLGTRTNTIMQSAFFKVSEVIPYDLAVREMKAFITKSYGTKGEKIVNMNFQAVDKGSEVIKVDVPAEWASLEIENVNETSDKPDFIKNVVEVINAQKGDSLPVSTFTGIEDGTIPNGTAAYEKRGIAVQVPEWTGDSCTQCNQCAYVCPHACIRPFLITPEEAANAPEGTDMVQGKGPIKDYQYRISVSVLDCTGCGVCVEVCPSNPKSLEMVPLGDKLDEVDRWNYLHKVVGYKEDVVDKFKNVKNSQFAQPLFEFSGACAGCGETPYIKAATQLFGERMLIANATGCSSIYGGTAPSTPYCKNEKSGKGPAWANSLFEDNAEYGYGMAIGVRKIREGLCSSMKEAIESNNLSEELTVAMQEWIDGMNDTVKSEQATEKLLPLVQNDSSDIAKHVFDNKHYLIKKSVWIIGGDGWAYDIGFGGLDHVIASGENVNILVLDTEVYSNTGGQASKSSTTGQVAKFAATGRHTRKKSLSSIVMTYGYVYVAQVAMGASQSQFFKALKEAEEYDGPSVIIAYSPCIAHGLKAGMNHADDEEKFAVDSGYWQMFRYNPLLEKEGKNPMVLDQKEPNWDLFQQFIDSEVRFASLKKSFPEQALELQKMAVNDAKWRYYQLKRMAEMPPIEFE